MVGRRWLPAGRGSLVVWERGPADCPRRAHRQAHRRAYAEAHQRDRRGRVGRGGQRPHVRGPFGRATGDRSPPAPEGPSHEASAGARGFRLERSNLGSLAWWRGRTGCTTRPRQRRWTGSRTGGRGRRTGGRGRRWWRTPVRLRLPADSSADAAGEHLSVRPGGGTVAGLTAGAAVTRSVLTGVMLGLTAGSEWARAGCRSW